MDNAQRWVHPTRYSGEYPDWSGYTFLDYDSNFKTYHPGEDYNWGVEGNSDLGQAVVATAKGTIVHVSKSTTGYGNLIVIKHTLGYNLKRFIKEMYGIDTNELYSLYAHLQDILVSVGNEIDAGALIAHVGSTGTAWAHLHFEIFAPIGDLLKVDWRFYPTVGTGWTKEKTQQYYLPAYKFIEATKQIDDLLDTYLGKPKAYWEQVEKDRESLLKQVGEKDKQWALKLEAAQKLSEIEIGKLKDQLLESGKAREKAEKTAQEVTDKFAQKEAGYKDEIEKLKIRNSQLIDQNAETFKFWEAVRIAVTIAKKNVGL